MRRPSRSIVIAALLTACGTSSQPADVRTASVEGHDNQSATPVVVAAEALEAWRNADVSTLRTMASQAVMDEMLAGAAPATTVARGCVDASLPADAPTAGAEQVCVYALPYGGELDFDLVDAAGGWTVIGVRQHPRS